MATRTDRVQHRAGGCEASRRYDDQPGRGHDDRVLTPAAEPLARAADSQEGGTGCGRTGYASHSASAGGHLGRGGHASGAYQQVAPDQAGPGAGRATLRDGGPRGLGSAQSLESSREQRLHVQARMRNLQQVRSGQQLRREHLVPVGEQRCVYTVGPSGHAALTGCYRNGGGYQYLLLPMRRKGSFRTGLPAANHG